MLLEIRKDYQIGTINCVCIEKIHSTSVVGRFLIKNMYNDPDMQYFPSIFFV